MEIDSSASGAVDACGDVEALKVAFESGALLFRRMIDALPAAIYTTDAAGRLTNFNQACVDFSGRTPEIGSDHWCVTWKLFYPDGRPLPHDKCPMASALKEGRAVRGAEAIAERPDGTRIWFQPYPTPLFDEAGKVIGGINMLVDITERKEAEIFRAHLAAIVANSDDAIISKRLDGVITSWNASAERLFGYSVEQAIGQPITMLIPTDRLGEEPKIIERLKRGERVDHFETKRVRKDGSLLDISLTISPIVDAGGTVIGASKIARDITAQKRADEAIRDSEERFRMVADNISQLAWTCDKLGNTTWYNQRWLDYTGLTFDEMRDWGWKQCHHPDHIDRVVASVTRSRESGEVWEDTFPLRGKDGKYRWFLSRAIPIRDEQGGIRRWFGTNTDVTAQLEAEETLREADLRKNEFLATLAHELRNPLASVCNSLQLLALDDTLSPAVVRIREIMDQQSQQLIRLVDDLWDSSRISRGQIELRRSIADLAGIVASAVQSSRTNVERRKHQLAIQLPAEPVTLYVDPTRISQVLVNLINNAAKYTPPGGQIWLSAQLAEGGLELTVRDTGVGIVVDELSQVFDMYMQVESSKNNASGGLGLGLALAKKLVELHDGQIEATSEGENLGTEFRVWLPASCLRKESTPFPTLRSMQQAESPLRILIVDDTFSAAFVLSSLLEKLGHKVETAADAMAAIDAGIRRKPQIVISDVAMPGIDGYELARRLKAMPEMRGVMLVALTGYGQDSDRIKSEAAGFDRHLVKPISIQALQELASEYAASAYAG